MSFSVDELARIAIDLQSDIGHTDRFFAPDYYPAANSWLRCLGAAAL